MICYFCQHKSIQYSRAIDPLHIYFWWRLSPYLDKR